MNAAAGFLPAMIARRRARVAVDLAAFTSTAAVDLAAAARPPRDLLAALRDRADVAVIAEFKRASPSAGDIAPGADPAARAALYAAGGAAAVSVLCEPDSFGGSLDDLAAAAEASALPTLCKDFVVDERQLYAARACGADAVLLMVSVLGERLGGYLALARDLGMQALVEVHDAAELALALGSGAALVGVNSRDLRDLTVDVAGALPLVREAAEAGVTVVAESGIRCRADVAAAGAAGASAVLVGTRLMRSATPQRELAALTGVGRPAAGAPASAMRRTRVKVCGITNAHDAAMAVAAGADALGVVLAPGPRRVTLAQAEGALAAVPPLVARVGVFVDAGPAFVAEAVARLRLTAVQFHGAEPPERCASAPAPVIKALRVGEGFSAGDLEAYRGSVAAVLLDTFVPGRAGGTGRSFEWERLAGALPRFAPVIVAGGLTPLRVGRAMRALHPFAVDVSSGVEERPGHKDREAVHAFIAAVAAADKEEDA